MRPQLVTDGAQHRCPALNASAGRLAPSSGRVGAGHRPTPVSDLAAISARMLAQPSGGVQGQMCVSPKLRDAWLSLCERLAVAAHDQTGRWRRATVAIRCPKRYLDLRLGVTESSPTLTRSRS